MHQITEGGILAALWNLTEASGTGLEADLKRIAVKQETIEVCEYFHLNPYQMTSARKRFACANDGEGLTAMLQREGVQASVIGKLTDGR